MFLLGVGGLAGWLAGASASGPDRVAVIVVGIRNEFYAGLPESGNIRVSFCSFLIHVGAFRGNVGCLYHLVNLLCWYLVQHIFD